MFRTRATTRDLGELLDELPTDYRVTGRGTDRLVVGPTGVFLVGWATGDVAAAAEHVARAADGCRAALTELLGWAPFVDSLVVSDHRSELPTAASVVSRHMLRDTIVQGPVLLTDDRLRRIIDAAEAAGRAYLLA